jgi:hypothetical protein
MCPPKPSTAGRLFHHFSSDRISTAAEPHNMCQQNYEETAGKAIHRSRRMQLSFLILIAICGKKSARIRVGKQFFNALPETAPKMKKSAGQNQDTPRALGTRPRHFLKALLPTS